MGIKQWIVIVTCALCSPALAANSITEVSSFGTNPGQLRMYEYVPASIVGPAPLVIALHGCTQSASAYVNAGWNELAELAGFYVAYAEVPSSKTPQTCFDWYDSANIARSGAEPVSIKQMVDAMKAKHAIDDQRVFVTGLSAGGAMTAVMLATYPDVFAAGAVMSGLPYACATSQSDAYTCMSGVTRTAQAWGDLARTGFPGWTGARPRLSVWQGSADYTVAPANQTALVEQWANLLGIAATPTSTSPVSGATHAVYADGSGGVAVESYLIPKMGHGTALEVGFAPAGGCGQAGAFMLDAGICSTWYAAQFFGLVSPVEGAADGGVGATGDLGPGASGLPGVDAGAGSDGTAVTPGGSAGCGCQLAGRAGTSAPPLVGLLMLGVAYVISRRRIRYFCTFSVHARLRAWVGVGTRSGRWRG